MTRRRRRPLLADHTWPRWLLEIPLTQMKFAGTMLLVYATGARVIILGWTPPDSWLWFLAALAGIDVTQLIGRTKILHKSGE